MDYSADKQVVASYAAKKATRRGDYMQAILQGLVTHKPHLLFDDDTCKKYIKKQIDIAEMYADELIYRESQYYNKLIKESR